MQTKKLANIEISINRLRSEKAVLQNKIKKNDNKLRKARTRTLIQLGGLLELTSLPTICNIKLGDDLQLKYPDNAATILGILLHISEKIPATITKIQLEEFKNKGYKLLNQQI